MRPFYDEGPYIGEVVDQALTKASTGTPQFVLKVKILGTPEDDGSYTPARSQYERTIYMALTDKTLPFVSEKLEVLGFDGESVGQLDPSHPRHVSFRGKQVDLYCRHDQDQKGDTREKWDVSTGPRALKVTPLSAKDVRGLDALFGKTLKAQKNARVSTPVRSEETDPVLVGTEITDEDIPF